MKKIYLIRHAQSEENATDLRLQTTVSAFNQVLLRSHESPLTEQGRRQALALVTRLAGERIDRLYTSPFIRALSTATIVGEAFDMVPEVIEELREVMPGPLRESLRSASLRRLWLRSYLTLFWPSTTSESWARAYRRARTVLDRLAADPAETIVAVSHRGFISLVLLAARQSRQWRILARDLSNGGMSIVVRKGTA